MADLFIKNKTLIKCYNIENVILSVTLLHAQSQAQETYITFFFFFQNMPLTKPTFDYIVSLYHIVFLYHKCLQNIKIIRYINNYLIYIYIYIYITETFEAPTIFQVSTILKK